MQQTNYVKILAGPMFFLVLLGIGWQTRETWKGWLIAAKDDKGDAKPDDSPDNPDRVKISKQAQSNLNLIVVPTSLTTYRRKIYLPGTVVDKPGHSDRGIPAP